MKTINIDNKLITKKIDYSFLKTIYKEPIKTNLTYFHDIDKLADIIKGAELLKKHIEKGSLIAVVCDYDCDGITSGTVLTKGLLEVFGVSSDNVITIVNRRKLSNGFNSDLVNQILEANSNKEIGLLISSDHGSNDNEAFKKLKAETNMDLLITDHHTIKIYPDTADVFINPMREDSEYVKSISGCCVAFLLLVKTYIITYNTNDTRPLDVLTPYVALSTITDCMDMSLAFNRYIVKIGLRVMNSDSSLFWNILKSKLSILKVNEVDLGFKIGPIINCGNCLNSELVIYDMLMETDLSKIEYAIDEAMKLNNLRKKLTSKYTDIAKEMYNKEDVVCLVIDVEEDAILNGKIASSIGNMFNKPTIIFSYENKTGTYVGSGRGIIENFNILEIVEQIKYTDNTILKRLGGHDGALGCSIDKDKFDLFKEYFNNFTRLKLKDIDSNVIKPDAFIPANDINMELYEKQQVYSPFGINYREPIYLSRLRLDSYFQIANIMAKMNLSGINNNDKIEGIYFFNDTSVTRENIRDFVGKNLYVVYTLKLSSFRGSYTMTLNIIRMEKIE